MSDRQHQQTGPAPDGAWARAATLASGRWGLAAALVLAAVAVLLLAGGPGETALVALGALAVGAAVVGGFWASRAPDGRHVSRVAGVIAAPRAGPSLDTGVPDAGHRQPPGAPGSQDGEVAGLEALMGALPELGLLMDEQGRADVVFGRPLAGVDVQALHEGLADLAAPADRRAVLVALSQARAGGRSEVVFGLNADPRRRLRLSVARTPEGGLAGLLMDAPAALPPAPPAEAGAGAALATATNAATQAETERDAAKAESAAKSRFLANMSHELRTPLNAIIGFSDIMRTKLFGPLPERYGEYAELIHESGRHLTDLINDILDMSKLEADRYELQREVFDAREPVGSALKLLRLQADDKGVHLRGDLPSAPLMVDADRRALKQIVLNLVSNALKFTPPEGRIDVTLGALSNALELVVADTGVGIAPEDLARLGAPYEQTDAGRRAQGTGLGLSLVKALSTLHGGEFTLESRLGEGSAATVRLPVLTATPKVVGA